VGFTWTGTEQVFSRYNNKRKEKKHFVLRKPLSHKARNDGERKIRQVVLKKKKANKGKAKSLINKKMYDREESIKLEARHRI
jgi:hypothetical protein